MPYAFGSTTTELYAKRHFTAFEAEKINEFWEIVRQYLERDTDDDIFAGIENVFEEFWGKDENLDALIAFSDRFENDIPNPDEYLRIKEGDEYYIQIDRLFPDSESDSADA